MHIVGTAGHVDHGKSALIHALTGLHPDRLKEEIAREMTIELGFASLNLPSGEPIGIIDVPGHIDFISNMLAGIGSIDAVLLVIAADEGVAPQTREHLAIIDLLGIKKGLVVLTKADLITDPDWLELVKMDVAELLNGTSLAEAEILPVSSKTGRGIPELLASLDHLLADTPAKKNIGKPRLPVDRVFSLQGFGTIVTGTLLDGTFAIGEEVTLLPGQKNARIRGIQNHNHKLQKVGPGFRTALNLSGINKEDIQRGDLVIHPGDYQTSRLIDLQIRALKDIHAPIKHNQAVNLYIGASESAGHLRLLGLETLKPGDQGFVQITLENAIVAAKGDRVILRLPSPSITIGGGEVLDPHPTRRYKRFDEKNLERLKNLAAGSETQPVLELLSGKQPFSSAGIAARLHLDQNSLQASLGELISAGLLARLNGNSQAQTQYLATASLEVLQTNFLNALNRFHSAFPLRTGMPREDLRTRLGLNKEVFDLLTKYLLAENAIRDLGLAIASADHTVQLNDEQYKKAEPLLKEFTEHPYGPPDFKTLDQALGSELTEGLVTAGYLIRVSDEIFFSREAFRQMEAWARERIENKGALTLAEFRDHFKTSRKYAAALLEYLDTIGITVRKGDSRVLRRVQ